MSSTVRREQKVHTTTKGAIAYRLNCFGMVAAAMVMICEGYIKVGERNSLIGKQPGRIGLKDDMNKMTVKAQNWFTQYESRLEECTHTGSD